MTRTIRRTSMICLIVVTVPSGCAPVGPGGASDVPWLKPDAWPYASIFLARPETEGSKVLLLAHQTLAEWEEDGEDGFLGNGPHGPVYRIEPVTGIFELVADESWDSSDGSVTHCAISSSRPSAIVGSGQRLSFDGEPIAFQGNLVLAVQPARYSPAVAVMSTDGHRTGIPFLTPGGATGQYYHQLFSEIDGEPLLEALRLPVGGPNTMVRVCWTRDERYVIYSQSAGLVAVVPVADEMALLDDLGDGGASDVPCLQPSAWPDYLEHPHTRPETPGSDVLLLTHLTFAQEVGEQPDPSGGGDPHGPVYRFDPATEEFELVADEVWDDSDGQVTDCWSAGGRPIPFTLTAEGVLTFEGELVDVAGGAAVRASGAPDSAVVAVLSTDGTSYFRPYGNGFTGQYYHQLFSEVDGQPLAEAVRVDVEWRDALPSVCWTADERYVLYYQDAGRPLHDLVCVVRVDDELALLEGEPAP